MTRSGQKEARLLSVLSGRIKARRRDRGLSLDRHGLEFRVVPNQRPKVFRVDLAKSLQPCGYTLGFTTLKALGQAID